MQSMIHIGPSREAIKELSGQLKAVQVTPILYSGWCGMFIDAWLKNRIAHHLREATTIKGLAITNCVFNSDKKIRK